MGVGREGVGREEAGEVVGEVVGEGEGEEGAGRQLGLGARGAWGVGERGVGATEVKHR